MAEEKIFLTKDGYAEMEKRLNYLKSEARIEIANKIEVARSFGDISENSEYDAAREEEAQLAQEIARLEDTLRNAEIIAEKKLDTSKVSVGSTVTVIDVEDGSEEIYKITGSFEADPTKGLISNESPIGKALLGAKKGDVVTISTHVGSYQLKIANIQIKA